MKRMGIATFALALSVIAGEGPVHAQDAIEPRKKPDGMWVGAGAGGGWVRITCAICRTDRNLGPSGYIRLGTTLRPGLLLAVQADGWTREESDVRSTTGAAGVSAYLYPDPARGVFLKSGVAWVRYSVGGGSAGTSLFGLLIGAGYEFPVTSGVSVTNHVNLLASSFGTLRSDRGTAASDVSLSLLQFGIGIRRH